MSATQRTSRAQPRPRPPAVDPGYIKSTQEFREHEVFLIREAHHRLQTKIGNELRKRGVRGDLKITFPMARVLHEVSIEPGMSNAQLARRVNVTAQTMNDVVVALEKAGYIERVADPENARVLRCYALPAGVSLMEKSVSTASAAFDAAVGMLSARDRAELRRLLKLLIDKIGVGSVESLMDEIAHEARHRRDQSKRRGSR
jgi:DNA-binding MarR family transcriptional regulator